MARKMAKGWIWLVWACTVVVLVWGGLGARRDWVALGQEGQWTEDLRLAASMRHAVDANLSAGLTDPCQAVQARRSSQGHQLSCEGGAVRVRATSGQLWLYRDVAGQSGGWRCRAEIRDLNEVPHVCL